MDDLVAVEELLKAFTTEDTGDTEESPRKQLLLNVVNQDNLRTSFVFFVSSVVKGFCGMRSSAGPLENASGLKHGGRDILDEIADKGRADRFVEEQLELIAVPEARAVVWRSA